TEEHRRLPADGTLAQGPYRPSDDAGRSRSGVPPAGREVDRGEGPEREAARPPGADRRRVLVALPLRARDGQAVERGGPEMGRLEPRSLRGRVAGLVPGRAPDQERRGRHGRGSPRPPPRPLRGPGKQSLDLAGASEAAAHVDPRGAPDAGEDLVRSRPRPRAHL